MSLTSHLKYWKQSPIGQFLRHHFSQTDSITTEINKQLRNASPLRPAGQVRPPYGALGMAIDYRIRYSFAITPSKKLAAWLGGPMLAFKPLEGNDDVPVENYEIPRGIGIPTKVDASGRILGIAHGPYSWKMIEAFFDSLDA